ncbi:hypothetical protein [Nakamurella multipartita]|nr:hypothetical protein [Nakamurella multipartita]HOZ57562.1 hypothetical protein [Nakamurella multipartita]
MTDRSEYEPMTDHDERHPRRVASNDSAYATALLKIGAPIACPTCGSFTEPTERAGWRCTNARCVFAS